MKNEFKRIKEQFPYKIFQRNEENKKEYLNNNNKYSEKKERKPTIKIIKNLKLVTRSTDIFKNYMINYKTMTEDYCFKSPSNSVYPLRKNKKYLSAASLKDIEIKTKLMKNKKKRPISAIISENNKINENKYKIKIKQYKIKNKRNNRINNNNLGKTNSLSEKFNKSIDLDNNEFIKNKNFDFLVNYITYFSYKNLVNKNNNFNKSKLTEHNILSIENLKYELSIYSICLKFSLINNNNKIKYQKLYLQFKYLPIFYLLEYEIFKVFITEIIFYENNNFCIKDDAYVNQICDKYSRYINSYIKDIDTKKYETIFYKNEYLFPSCYKWLIYNNDINSNENNKYKIFELKIEFPKIKLKISDKGTIIKNILKKNLLIQLMINNFESWEKTILFELFYIKKIRNTITSLVKDDSQYIKQKINMFPFYIIKKQYLENSFQFFISDIINKSSKYYIFCPYKIILSQRKKTFYKEIQLSLNESRILYKFKNIWGTENTLFRCINIEKRKNDNNDNIEITFNFNLLSDLSDEFSEKIEKNLNNKKEKDKFHFKLNKIDINLINCSLKRKIIGGGECQEKLYEINQDMINMILEKKLEIIIFERMNKYCEDILNEKEYNIKMNINKRELMEENEKNIQDKNNIEKSRNLNKNRNKKILTTERTKSKKLNFKHGIVINKSMKNIEKNKRILKPNFSIKNLNKFNNIVNKEVKDSLFLTKNISNNKVENFYVSESESSEVPSISFKYKYTKPFINKNLNMIKNPKDLKQNRIMRNSHVFKNDFNMNKLKKIISILKRKKEEENIHNNFYN